MNKYSYLALLIAFCTSCDDDSSYEQGPLRLGTGADPSFAVTLRDEDEAALGLLDSSGEIVRAVYVESKTELLDRALHDQLAIPSNPELEGVFTVLNRAPADYVLRIDYFNGQVLADVSTRPDAEEDFSVDPRDYLYLDERHAWVTRYEPNLESDAAGLSLGDDLLLIEPGSGKLVKRIDLSSLYEDVRYEAKDGEVLTAMAYARPSSLIGLEKDQAYVGLDRLSADLQAAAPGAGLVLDLDKAKFVTVEFGALRRCGKAVAVAGKRDAVLVSCAGHPLGDRPSSGLAYVEISAGKGVVKHTFRAEGDTPVAVFSPVSLGGTRVVVTERGELSGGEDALHLLDLKGGELEEIERFESAKVLGEGGAFQRAAKLLLIANRAQNRILRFAVDEDGVKSDGQLALESELQVDGVFALKRF